MKMSKQESSESKDQSQNILINFHDIIKIEKEKNMMK